MASYKKESIIKSLARLILQIPKQIKIFYCRKKGFFVVTDRYIYDLVNFYSPLGFFRYLTKTLFQKPTKIFYIKSPPNIIIKRKKELTLNSIKNLQNNIESNKEFFGLTVIENKDIKKTCNTLELHLKKIIKNV
jgi:thymidylate kinase